MTDRYSSDVLADGWRTPKAAAPAVPAEVGLVVEEAGSGWCGAVTRVEAGTVELEDRHGKRRNFPLGGGFLIDGTAVRLVAAITTRSPGTLRTASGSFAVDRERARIARASRILVEGRHDAELIEKVWGTDLRIEGVVVEYLGGIDDLAGLLGRYSPGPGTRIGVLVDHLVPGSKETRLVEAARHGPHAEFVHIVGHPYIDIWQAIRPKAVGISAWPDIPRSIEWKKGICRSFGWPDADQADIARAWQRLLDRVTTYADLEPALLGRVEELIDFVTADA